MGIIREPKNVDFTVQSVPWTKAEFSDFRKLMAELKAKNAVKKNRQVPSKKKKITA